MQNISGLTTVSQPKKRESNLELFRIITMILIVAHHYVVNSGLTSVNGPIQADPTSWRSIFLLVFGSWGKIGINCFVMITGYFMCKSQISVKKFLKLVLELLFYNIIIYLAFLLSGYEPFSIKNFLQAIIPITEVNTNFTSCFLIFYLLIPFLNLLINKMNERQHVGLILICCFMYVFLGTIHRVIMNYVSWFIVLYFIASYFRLYQKKCFSNTRLWGVLTVTSVVISYISVITCAWLGTKINKFVPFLFVTDSNTLLALITGICAFMFFKNIKLKYNRFINIIAGSTFGVLCIHANSDTMRQWLWKDTLNNVGNYDSQFMMLHAIGSVLCIFVVCIIIDIIRINLIEKPFFSLWDKHYNSINLKFKYLVENISKKLNIE